MRAWARAALLFCAAAVVYAPSARASLYDPHVPTFYDPAFRTWLESWYVRITTVEDAEGGEVSGPFPTSLGFVLGTMPRGRLGWNISLVSLLIQYPNQPLEVYETTGAQLSVSVGAGQPVLEDPEPHTPPDFTAEAEDGSALLHMQGQECTLHVSLGGYTLDAQCTGVPDPWGPDDESPEGAGSGLPTQILGRHWFVYSLGTPMSWTLRHTASGSILNGSGLAHFEKNWGGTFPTGWTWAQGMDPGPGTRDGRGPLRPHTAFALAGGDMPSPVLPGGLVPDTWLLGVRSPGGRDWSFRPQDPTTYETSGDACAGNFSLTAHSPWSGRSAVVSLAAAAGPAAFGPVICATSEGFEPGHGAQSYGANVTIELYEGPAGWWGGERQLVEVVELQSAALEFGGERMCGGGPAVVLATA